MISPLFNQIFEDLKNFKMWIESIILFIVVFSAGFLFKRYLVKFIKSVLLKAGLVLRDEIVTISNSYVSFWFFLIALYVAFLRAPVSTNAVVHKLFYGVFAFSVVTLIASVLSRLFQKSVSEKIGTNIIKFSVIFVGLVLILNQLGIKLTPILTALGVGSIAVALGLHDILANFFAGINIIASKQIVTGDYIKLDSGQEGTIIEINWRTTLLRELSNTVITVPNSKLLSSVVTSFQLHGTGITTLIKCGVAYGSDLEHVEKIAILAAQEIIDKYEDSIKTFIPIVQFTDFADSSIDFIIIFKVKSVYTRNFIRSEVLKNLYKKFNEEKIEIPYPQRVVALSRR